MFSFVIPTCVQNILHMNQLIRCLNSIRLHHLTEPIYLINDSNTSLNELDIHNVIVFNTLNKGSADQQVFKIILDYINDDSSHYVIMQDSMILNKPITNINNIEYVKFLWHFTNHITHWDNIMEPNNEYNTINYITNHTSLIRHCILKDYLINGFINYAIDSLENKFNWVGCFGNCCIITKKCISQLNKYTGFADTFVSYNNNRLRRANESIFAMLCHYYIPQNYSDSYDGLYYDGINSPNNNGILTGFDNLHYCCVNNIFSKISFDR